MANLSRLDLVYKAIRAGTFGHIEWKDEAYRRVLDDPVMQGFTPNGIKALLRDFVVNKGGQIDVRDQGMEQWVDADPENPYWYRAILPVSQFPKGLFVEIVIADYDEQCPWIAIVSSHPQL